MVIVWLRSPMQTQIIWLDVRYLLRGGLAYCCGCLSLIDVFQKDLTVACKKVIKYFYLQPVVCLWFALYVQETGSERVPHRTILKCSSSSSSRKYATCFEKTDVFLFSDMWYLWRLFNNNATNKATSNAPKSLKTKLRRAGVGRSQDQ